MERGFKYRIYPNESQRDQIARTFGCCRFVYNRALDVKKTAYSETCSACGHRLDALPLSVRSWDCPACGAHHDRDVNAARNILTEGKRILSNTEGTAGHAGTVAAITA